MIIGLTGPLATGKGTITEYLTEKYDAKTVKFSQPLRDIIHRVHKKETREGMAKLAQFLRSEYGNDILVRTLIQDLDKMDVEIAVFDGIRYYDELNALKERSDFVLWSVDANMKIRYERIQKRGENADDKTISLDTFREQHTLPTEVMIPELIEKADFAINNDGTINELYTQIDAFLIKSRDAIKN